MLNNTLRTTTSLSSLALLSVLGLAAPATSSRLGALAPSGNFVVAGSYQNQISLRSPSIRVMSRLPNGNVVWAKSYSQNTSRDNYPAQLQIDASGNVYVAGYSVPTSGAANATSFLVKFNASGVQQWTTTYPSSGSLPAGATTGLALDSSGNPYVSLHWTGSSGGTVSHVLKYSPTGGAPSIDRTIPGPLTTSIESILIDASNAVFLAGTTNTSTVGNTASVADGGYVGKFDASLTTTWQSYDPIAVGTVNTGLALDASGNPAASFSTNGFGSTGYAYYATARKVSSAGSVQWTQSITSSPFAADAGIIVDAAGDVVLGGTERGPNSQVATGTRLAKLSGSNGLLAWNANDVTSPNGGSKAASLAQEAGGSYIVVSSVPMASGGQGRIWARQYQSDGTIYYYWYWDPTNGFSVGQSVVPTTTVGTFYVGGQAGYYNGGSGSNLVPWEARIANYGGDWNWYQSTLTP